MGNSLNDSSPPLNRIPTLKNPGPNKHSITSQLHHQRCISRSSHSTRRELHDRQPPKLLCLHNQIIRRSKFLCKGKNLIIIHISQHPYIPHHRPDMPNSFNNVPRARLAFSPNHCRPFPYPPQGLTQISASANKRDAEIMFVNVVFFISQCKNLGFVNIIDTYRFKNLGFDEMPDSGLSP
ncbi:hypothetical protein OIU78_003123 [Salix suchowensis]|nr:hypothetical protein OIU78_003123 [Salix suchowensis]